jgi:hypothetical protein
VAFFDNLNLGKLMPGHLLRQFLCCGSCIGGTGKLNRTELLSVLVEIFVCAAQSF